jgi:CcmD family protein
MRFCRALFVAALLMAAPVAPVAFAAQPKPSADEFVPMDEVPPEEQIPAITLVAAAYGFVWIVVVGYVWSLGRRLQKAEGEIAALEQRRR